MPTSGLACKYQLRGTGCRAGLRSDSTMKEAGARVQRKLFIRAIGSCGDSRLGCPAKAKHSGSRRRFSPLDDAVTPLNRFFARSAAPVCQTHV